MILRACFLVAFLSFGISGNLPAFGQAIRDERRVERVEVDEPNLDPGRKWAVVIGANEYLDPALPSLKYCVADAELVAKQLIERCGYEAERVLLITDRQPRVHMRPLKRNLQIQIPDWLKRARPSDTVIVFFAGHGFLDARNQGFLAPQDYEKDNPGLSGFRTDDLRDMLKQCKATQKLLVLDCCHSGGERGDSDNGSSSEELGASFRAAEGLVTLASCKKLQTSREWEAKQHGLFTYFLAEGLSGDADSDKNGLIDSDELYHYTLEKVSLIGQRELNARQTPVRIIGEDVVGRFVLSRTNARTVRSIYEVTIRPIGDPMGHLGPITNIGLTPNGNTALVAYQMSDKSSVDLWDLAAEPASGKPLSIGNTYLSAMGISPDGRMAATAFSTGTDHRLLFWGLPSGIGESFDDYKIEDTILSVEFSPDGRTLLATTGKQVRLWDAATRRPLGQRLEHEFQVLSGTFSADGSTILTGSGIVRLPEDKRSGEKKGQARLWSAITGKPIGEPLAFDQMVNQVRIGKNGHFFTREINGVVKLWRSVTDLSAPLTLKGSVVRFATFSPDGGNLATVGFPHGQIWDVATGKQISSMQPMDAFVNAVVFSPDCRWVLTGSGGDDKGQAQLWDVQSGQLLGSLTGHTKAVTAVSFSGDGRKILTGSSDRTARLWEVIPKGK